ncbi:hypothetical protein AURDEDRAFT_127900 [Auricularia subglabra TFB-10046 SS5]|nr:hypothetical protein AURDEDRAFT_127900 [Auricularia subglabra TFB-10046 SS5]
MRLVSIFLDRAAFPALEELSLAECSGDMLNAFDDPVHDLFLRAPENSPASATLIFSAGLRLEVIQLRRPERRASSSIKLADFLAIPGQQMANRGRLMAYAHRNGLGTGILTALAHADWSADVMNTSIEVLIEDEDAVSPERPERRASSSIKLADFLAIPGQQMANRGRLMAYAHRNGLGTGILTALAHADWSADVMNTSIEVLIEDEDAVSPEWEGLVCGFDVVLAKADELLQGPIDPNPERDASVTAREPDAERNDTMHAAPKAERDETKDKAPDPARDEPKDKAPKPARDEPKDNAPKPERDATKDNASDPARDKTKDGAPDPKRADGVDADWDAAVTGTSAATTPGSTSPSPSALSPSVGVSTELTSASSGTPSPTEQHAHDASKPSTSAAAVAHAMAASRDATKHDAPGPARDETKHDAPDQERDAKDDAPDVKSADEVDPSWKAAVTGTEVSSAATTPSSTCPSPSALSLDVGASTEPTSASDVTPSPTEERAIDGSKPDDTGNRASRPPSTSETSSVAQRPLVAHDTAASRDTAPPPVSAERQVPPQPTTTPPPIPPPPPPPRASTGRHVLPHPTTTPPPRPPPPPPPPAGSAAPTRFRMAFRVSQPRRLTGLLAMHDDDDE